MRRSMKSGTRLLLSVALALGAILALSAGIITTGYFSDMARSVSMITAAHAGGRPSGGLDRPEGRQEGSGPERDGGSGLSAASFAKVGGYAALLAGVAWSTAALASLARKARLKETPGPSPTPAPMKEEGLRMLEAAGGE